jgi:hypothetical protein
MKNKWGSHLLETLNKTESQTGPSQQIDYYRLAREIVNLQNSQNISATGNNHSIFGEIC